jgi:hypothetical protein
VEYLNPRERRTKDIVVRGTTVRLTSEKGRRAEPKCKNDIRDRGLKQQLLTYGAEPFLRSRQLCSHSRTWTVPIGSVFILECLLFPLLCR